MNRLRQLIEHEKQFAQEHGYVYSPNSLRHLDRPPIEQLQRVTLELARLQDFLEFLFDHSEHCDHITYSEAWHEFEEYERPQRQTWNKKLTPTP